MTEPRISFFVSGKPQPRGSKNAIPYNKAHNGKLGVRFVDNNPRSDDWMGECKREALDAMAGEVMLEGPIEVILRFKFLRPQGHYSKAQIAMPYQLTRSAPKMMRTKPDIDKLIRAVLDALTGIAMRDDNQVARIQAEKEYCNERPGAQVTVIALEPGQEKRYQEAAAKKQAKRKPTMEVVSETVGDPKIVPFDQKAVGAPFDNQF